MYVLKIDIICPLYKGAGYIDDLNKNLLKQEDVSINEIKYVLTNTNDESEDILKRLGCNYDKIEPSEFSHSLTREKAAMGSSADIVVFITQDIDIRNKDWLCKLVSPIISGEVEASYSRQMTKYDNIEKYTREANYPDKSFVKSKDDIKKYGLKTFFFSDASSAVKREIYVKINGYDNKNLPINEDLYLASKLIMNGYKIKYCADSVVYHSHQFTLKEIYSRYKLTGKFFKENSYLDQYGTNGSGASLAKYILKRIFQDKKFMLLFRYPFDMAARFIGMKAGKR